MVVFVHKVRSWFLEILDTCWYMLSAQWDISYGSLDSFVVVLSEFSKPSTYFLWTCGYFWHFSTRWCPRLRTVLSPLSVHHHYFSPRGLPELNLSQIYSCLLLRTNWGGILKRIFPSYKPVSVTEVAQPTSPVATSATMAFYTWSPLLTELIAAWW